MESPLDANPDRPQTGTAGPRPVKSALIALAVAGALSAFYALYWNLMARELSRGLHDWLAQRRAEGVSIEIAREAMDGFPAKLRLRLEGIDVAWPGKRPVRWHLPAAEAEAAPWRLQRVTFRLQGAQRIREGVGADTVDTDVIAKRLGGEVLVAGAGADLKVVAEELVAERAGRRLGAAARLDLDLRWRPLEGGRPKTSPLRFDLGIDDGDIPARWKTPFGQRIETLRFGGHVTGPLAGGALQTALRAWRDAGGTLEVQRLALNMGPLRLQTKGTVALDGDMQPEGAFTARAEGYFETVDALVAAHVMTPRQGSAAKLVLAVVATRPAGKTPFVETPLTLQDRALTAGPLKIARLGHIDWARLGQLVLPGAAP